MNTRERFKAAMNFQPFDRLPMIEWAPWWDKTIDRWHTEGLPVSITDRYDLACHFGLDLYYHDWIAPWLPSPAVHGGALVSSDAEYDTLAKTIYREDQIDRKLWSAWASQQQAGDAVAWFTLQGFFWYPRTLFGIEPHLYAFYDQPELMNRMNEDLLQWNLKVIDEVCQFCTPDFMTFAEDMSYNHGPMVSKELFDGFLKPFYQRITAELRRRGIMVIIDSDGDVTEAAQWYLDAGADGILPLERQAGVDMNVLRQRYPKARFIGHYDKMVMPRGEEAMRGEFERLLPVAARGGFIPSVDHQTPPGVSYQQYQIYLRLFREYAEKAGELSRSVARK